MSRITLSADEVEAGVLPPTCLVCGGAAPHSKRLQLRWAPAWTYLALPLGVLPWAALRLALQRTMVVHAPLCGRHTHHWLKRSLVVPAGVLASLGLLVAGSMSAGGRDPVPSWALLGAPALLLATAAAWVVLKRRGTRVALVTEQHVTLAGAHPQFIAAVETGRAEYARSMGEWLSRSGRR